MLITASFGSRNTGCSVFFTLLNPDKTVRQARTSAGITELVAGSGIYGVEISDTLLAGGTAVWDIDGTTKAAEETFPPTVAIPVSTVTRLADCSTVGTTGAQLAGML